MPMFEILTKEIRKRFLKQKKQEKTMINTLTF